jgi:acyl-CoA reductase-like NAD-dependent aldehyde dehydrogenase
VFGDSKTTARWAADPRIEVHGPGWSKLFLGPDEAPRWREHLDVIADSVMGNGGRSCINASAVYTPAHADELADALARRMAALEPRPADDPDAGLAAFANPKVAEAIDAAIERGLAEGGAEDLCARHRSGPRLKVLDGASYLSPTLVRCESAEHPLARAEYMFPFASVVEVPAERLVATLGHSLVVSAVTKDAELRREVLAARGIDRLNLGAAPTTRVDWDQPHEGNLFELLYRRRAIHRADGW